MKKILLTLFILLLLVPLAAAGLLLHAHKAAGPLLEPKEIFIERGTGFKAIAAQLEAEGVVANRWVFMIPARLDGSFAQVKAGEYRFEAGASARDVLGKLVRGEVIQRSVTIPEGLTVAEVTARLMAEPMLSGEVPQGIAEGSLLPDTYVFLRGDTRESIIVRMQRAMNQALAEAWQTRQEGLPLATPQEALILASIVEKETGVADERTRVAAVYINRLRIGMKLQADPTVAYGVVMREGSMERALTYADLRADTPYNTYTRTGLPPTPIANPGRAAIEATLHPLASNELYFVATGAGDGRHWFAVTHKEHEANVRKYRAVMRQKR